MKKLVSRIAFALELVAVPALVLAPSVPAQACGPSALTPAMRVRAAALADAGARLDDGTTASIHSVKIWGDSARVVVRFEHASGAPADVQMLSLHKDAGGGWRVTGRSYPIPASAVAVFERG
jgi:hypothetical protein